MSCCSSVTITPCTISVNDALSLLDGVGNNCGTLCNYSISTSMPPSPIPQFSSVIQVEENNVSEGFFTILNFWATGASTLTVTNAGGGQADIIVDTQLAEKILKADAITAINNSDLIPGKTYWIYDVGDGQLNPAANPAAAYAGIVLKAIDVDKFDVAGAYIARVPNTPNFWYNGGSYAIGSYVEHLNGVYTNNAAQTTPPYSIPPSANAAVWTRVPKSNTTYYTTEIYTCIYNILEDQIYNITDTRNNTLTVTKFSGTSINEVFLYCFRWGSSKVYGNKITINNIGSAGFFLGTYPNVARSGANKANFNFWDAEFSGNEIRLDFGKSVFGSSAFNSNILSGYSSFYQGVNDPIFNNNILYNCLTYVNENIQINDNIFYDCTLGTTTLNIIGPIPAAPLGEMSFSKFTRCSINNNTNQFARIEMSDCTISGNTNIDMKDVYGYIDIKNNVDCSFSLITSHTRVTNSGSYTTFNEINSNNNVFIEDVTGEFFRINSNVNISIRYNVTLYNAYIQSNTAVAAPLLLDDNGVNLIPGSGRLSCGIQQVQLDNQARIENNRWETAGGIVRTKLSGAEIRDMVFDFRDPLWAGGGGQVNPPATADMVVDAANVYLFQNRNKLSLYPHSATIDGANFTSFVILDGTVGASGTTLPMRGAYVWSGSAYAQLPYISTSNPYANGVNVEKHGGDAYVFLNTEDGSVYNAAAGGTLTLPAWTGHAAIIYLYRTVPFTATIANIIDSAPSRTIFNLRIVVLSDGLVLNLTTTAAAGAAAGKIVSSIGPAPATITISNKFDVLEIEKRNQRFYVSNYQKMV